MNCHNGLKQFNIEQYLRNKNIEYTVTSTNQLILKCPSCHKFKLYINNQRNKEYGRFLCFVSGCSHIKGNLVQLIMLFENLSYQQALSFVTSGKKKQYNCITNSLQKQLCQVQQKLVPLSSIVLPSSFKPLAEPNRYLLERGVTNKMVKKFNIHYSTVMQRIIFPIIINNQVVGWQGRDILGEKKRKQIFIEEYNKFGYLKMKNSKGLQKKKVLLNYDNVKNKEVIIIVEGPFDALKTRNSVALLGRTLSVEQLNLLLNTKARSIIIAIDPEEDEDRQLMFEMLSPFFQVYYLILPSGTDPGDYSCEQMDEFIKKKIIKPDKQYLSLKNVDLHDASNI